MRLLFRVVICVLLFIITSYCENKYSRILMPFPINEHNFLWTKARQVELQHCESRLLKLRHLRVDHVAGAGDQINNFEELEQMIEKLSRRAQQIAKDLERRIHKRRTEL